MEQEKDKAHDATYCDTDAARMLAFFRRAPYTIVAVEKCDRYGNVTSTKEERVPCEFPTFARYAAERGVTPDTLTAWRVHAAFDRAYVACEGLQKSIAIENAMLGRYDAGFVKFFLTNECGMQDGAAMPFAVDIRVVDG